MTVSRSEVVGRKKVQSVFKLILRMHSRDFVGSPAIKISPSNTGGVASIPRQGDKFSHSWWPKTKTKKNRSDIVTNPMKTLNMVHIKMAFKKCIPIYIMCKYYLNSLIQGTKTS